MQNLRALLEVFLQKNQMSASAFARAIGENASKLSQFRGGYYKGDNELLAKKISSYINNYQEKNNYKQANITYESNDFKMASFIIKESVEDKDIAIIYGEPGSGKSITLSEYEKNNSNALLIEVTNLNTTGVLLDELIEKLRCGATPKSLSGKLKLIARYLKTADKVILIDEAEHLPLKSLEALRRIHDFSRVPIILCGTEILLRNLRGKNNELKQLYSRICGKYIMRGLSSDESYKFFGVKSLFTYSNGNFRTSEKIYKKAKKLAKFENKQINDEHIKEAVKMVVL